METMLRSRRPSKKICTTSVPSRPVTYQGSGRKTVVFASSQRQSQGATSAAVRFSNQSNFLRGKKVTDKLNARNRASDTHKAPSSGACSLQPSLGRHTPLPPFDCCIDVHVELPFAPEAPPPIERVDNSQDSITDTPDAPLSSSNPFTNWIKNGSAPEPMSVATDNPPCPTGNGFLSLAGSSVSCPSGSVFSGQDYEHAIPIDGLLATNAGCTRKPLKGILKKSANQVAGACPGKSPFD